MWEGAHPPMILWSSENKKQVPSVGLAGGIFDFMVEYRNVAINNLNAHDADFEIVSPF